MESCFPNLPGGIICAPETNTSTYSKMYCDSPMKKCIVCEWKKSSVFRVTDYISLVQPCQYACKKTLSVQFTVLF